MPSVQIKLDQPIDIAHKDAAIEVEGLGRLKFSKGSVDWWPSGNHVNHFTLKWEELAALFEEQGKKKRKEK